MQVVLFSEKVDMRRRVGLLRVQLGGDTDERQLVTQRPDRLAQLQDAHAVPGLRRKDRCHRDQRDPHRALGRARWAGECIAGGSRASRLGVPDR